MKTIIEILDARMVPPTTFGWFHFLCVALCAVITYLLCHFCKNVTEKKYRKIIMIFWIIIVLFEIYKQFVYTFTIKDGAIDIKYRWYIFPFQFCSTPLYALPLIAFLKEEGFSGKVRNAAISFIATFSLFAGLAVFVYPEGVWSKTIGINIQTMIHHGTQIIIGIYTFMFYKDRFDRKMLLKGIVLFACFVLTALILNEAFLPITNGAKFNMFYISRHFKCSLPVLSIIYDLVPYPIFLGIYIFGFSLCAYLVYISGIGIRKLVLKKK